MHFETVKESRTLCGLAIDSAVERDAASKLQSRIKVLGHFAFLRSFPIHTGPTPPLTPQTMLDTCIQNFFRVSTLYKVRGWRTARKFWKGCTVLWRNWKMKENMNIAVLSQRLLSMIVGKWKGRHLSVEGTYIRMGYRLCQKCYIKE